ncbi:MAG: hypothetical protein U0905_14950 [Pirellulales bacterium]
MQSRSKNEAQENGCVIAMVALILAATVILATVKIVDSPLIAAIVKSRDMVDRLRQRDEPDGNFPRRSWTP